MVVYQPEDLTALAETVAASAAAGKTLEVIAGGSKRGIGRPAEAAHTLDLDSFRGILAYEPAELVMTAQAATPLHEIEAALRANRQMLAFEPTDWRSLLGSGNTSQTLGGVIACNLAGPRRLKAGAARDHFLGFKGVNGRGEIIKAGGQVVKNVTGYDLPKLLAGSYGTLIALTEISVKVLPQPETERTLLLAGLSDEAAIRGLSLALNSAHEVSSAAHLPEAAAALSAVSTVASAGRAVTALRVEGPAPSVGPRCTALAALLAEAGDATVLDDAESRTLWQEIGDVGLLPSTSPAVWRLSTAPGTGPSLAAEIAQRLACQWYYDWAGGLIWLAVTEDRPDAGSEAVRVKTTKYGGHATLIKAPPSVRAAWSVFDPPPPALAALSGRVKDSFDPARILNPGRMYAGV